MSYTEATNVDGVLVVEFNDSQIVDEKRIKQLGAELMDRANEAGGKLLLNFQQVLILSSAMLTQLVLLHNKCKKEDIDLRICQVSEKIMEVFKLVRFNKLVKVYDNEENALTAYNKRGLFAWGKN